MTRQTHTFRSFVNESLSQPIDRIFLVSVGGDPVFLGSSKSAAMNMAREIAHDMYADAAYDIFVENTGETRIQDDPEAYDEIVYELAEDEGEIKVDETTPERFMDMYGPEDTRSMLLHDLETDLGREAMEALMHRLGLG